MWNSSLRLILISVFCLDNFQFAAATVDAKIYDDYEYIYWKFENKSSLPAARNVTLTFARDDKNRNKTILGVTVHGAEVNLRIFVLAIPYVEHESDCPLRYQLREHPEYLRQHSEAKRIELSETFQSYQEKRFSFKFGEIFTGCYYVMTNSTRGLNLMVGPEFHAEGDFAYMNTKMALKKCIVKPEDVERTKELIAEIQVPLACIQVRAYLFVGQGASPEEWTIFRGTDGVITSSGVGNTTAKLEVVRNSYTEKDGWTAVVKWRNLSRGGNTYNVEFEPGENDCYAEHSEWFDSLNAWRLVVKRVSCNLGYLANDNRALPVRKSYIWIWTSSESVIAIVILAYWMLKFVKLIMVRKRRMKGLSNKSQGIYSNCSEKGSDQILLIYVKGSNLFTRAMCNFRKRLAQDCHCHVHDLYASEWNTFGKIGADGWVEKLLRDGSKVVWVDTPQFRSRLNDRENHLTGGDFRDNAIPYAVALATDLFQNATTQYRRHFVVRMEGFEVDDRQDDPLLVVSPHARYHIPEHFALLCEHLKGLPKPSENTTAEV